jgi:hypothetical protein
MRYQLFNGEDELVKDTDELEEIADHLDLSARYIYVRLSANKGVFTRGRGAYKITIKDTGRQERGASGGSRGPKRTDYRYAAVYPDEHPDSYRLPTHEVTLEEIMKHTKLSREQLMQKFASHAKVFMLLSSKRSYQKEPVVFKRYAPTPELDAVPSEPQPVNVD